MQVADGALAQVTNLLNRAVTLATESANGTVSDAQRGALDNEFTAIKGEIDRIGSTTTFNGTQVFSATPTDIFLSDSTTAGASLISTTTGVISALEIGLGANARKGNEGVIVTFTDKKSGEVVRQIPSEQVLRVARFIIAPGHEQFPARPEGRCKRKRPLRWKEFADVDVRCAPG